MSKELKHYVEKALSQGGNAQAIRQQLESVGWSSDMVEKTLDQFCGVDAWGVPVPAPRMQAHQFARDLFVYALSYITLMTTTCALGYLLFEIIDFLFPDIPSHSHVSTSGIHFAIASLAVAFPTFAALTGWVQHHVKKHTEKRESMVRRLVVYLFLATASVTAIGDLIHVIYTFLDGDFTIRFCLRTVVVLGVCALVFLFYFQMMREDDRIVGEQQ